MASSILFIAVLFFSVRGFFLAFPGVVARLSGFILGYFIAYSYRAPLAKLIDEKTNADLAPMIFQVLSGAILFFTTMFLVGLIVSGIFSLLTKIVPLSKGLLDSKSTSSRLFGAIFNGCIGASMVLIALWGYNIFSGNNSEPPDTLHKIAYVFGDSVLALAIEVAGAENINLDSITAITTSKTMTTATASTTTGSAEIFNSSSIDLQNILKRDTVQGLLNDPVLREQLMQQLNDNPEQMMKALNNPEFRQLMEQLN